MKRKVTLISSTGGHYMQLKQLIPFLKDRYDLTIITEKSSVTEKIDFKHHYLVQQERKSILSIFKILYNYSMSLIYFIMDRPNVVISTGAGCVVGYIIISKIFKCKVIYIESYAKTNSKTKTGNLIYKFADSFYVQWESMLDVYPDAKFVGGIY